jgi:hypothetical protein
MVNKTYFEDNTGYYWRWETSLGKRQVTKSFTKNFYPDESYTDDITYDLNFGVIGDFVIFVENDDIIIFRASMKCPDLP